MAQATCCLRNNPNRVFPDREIDHRVTCLSRNPVADLQEYTTNATKLVSGSSISTLAASQQTWDTIGSAELAGFRQ